MRKPPIISLIINHIKKLEYTVSLRISISCLERKDQVSLINVYESQMSVNVDPFEIDNSIRTGIETHEYHLMMTLHTEACSGYTYIRNEGTRKNPKKLQ